MSSGLYSGVSGLALGVGLYKGVSGLWGGASGLIDGFGGSFSPASLFAAGEPGGWYNPSDLSTMFQDSAGTTPVTATGQTVGLLLDKRLGSITQVFNDANVSFTGTAGYALRVSPGVYEYARDAANSGQVVFGGLTTGKSYLVSVQISNYAGSIPGIVGNRADYFSALSVSIRPFTSTNGTYTFYYVADGPNFIIRSGAPLSGATISNVSILDVPGNHLTQATAASRPIYGIEPFGGRRNLLVRTEEFDNAAWAKITTTVTANTDTAPDGTTTADTLAATGANSLVYQVVAGLANSTTYTLSVWVKTAGSGATATLAFYTAGGGTTIGSQSFTTTGSWQRVTLTATTGTLSGETWFAIGGASSFSTGESLFIWGAQLETGSTATAYQRVTDQWNVTEAGVPSVSYLAFDGTDDWFISPTITPGIDKAQVFAGVRKLADASTNTFFETGPNSGTTAGSLGMFSSPNGYRFRTGGSLLVDPSISTGYAVPVTNVLTGIDDIATDAAVLRINGVQVASSAADQGTGNFLAYPLYVGRRGGTLFSLNGRIYQLIVRFGANLDAATITATETFVNSKTGAYV